MPMDYYANYPGQLFIPLDRYIFGANVTYGVRSDQKENPPVTYVLQQNDTVISWWDKPPTATKYTLVRT